jgi:hypothetical protein
VAEPGRARDPPVPGLQPRHPRQIHRFLVFNHATLAGAYHIGGYDPLISAEHLELAIRLEYSNIFRYELDEAALDYLSAWSVRFLVVPERPELQEVLARFSRLRLIHRDGGLEVYENATALPFASFPAAGVPAPAGVRWGVNGLRVATGGRGGRLRLTVAPLAWYSWTADGVDMGAVTYDEQRRVLLDVPDGTSEVALRYTDVPFLAGAGVFWAFVLSLALTWGVRARAA